MTRKYEVIDADGHILEPLSLWDQYMDPAYRERAPRMILDDNGKERLFLEGQLLGNPKGLGRLGGVGARDGSVAVDTMKYAEGRPGGFDPHARIKDLDLDGIDAAFLYPSIGLFSGAVKDPKLAAAMCRAYNRWLADYCKPYPDRLFGIAMLPMQSIELAIEEMRFARTTLGMKGGFLRPNPYNDRMAGHPDYDPFWAEAQALDFSIGFHEGASGGMPTVGVDRFEGRGARHIISHTMEMMLVALSVIWGGVCERFPQIRIGFLESGGGWIAPWLDRMDRHFDDQGFNDSGLKTPTERAVPAELLDLLRAGGGRPRRARRLHRPQQDPVGHRLSARRRVLPRRAGDDRQPPGALRSHQARDPGRGRDGVLRFGVRRSSNLA